MKRVRGDCCESHLQQSQLLHYNSWIKIHPRFTLCLPLRRPFGLHTTDPLPYFSQPLAMAHRPRRHKPEFAKLSFEFHPTPNRAGVRVVKCKAADVSPPSSSSYSAPAPVDKGKSWVPVVPLAALPKGERRVIIQDGETVLLLWYKDDVFAIENRSPAEGAYSDGLLNAKLTQVCVCVCACLYDF
ncbi:Rieske (2Fe-2S) domain-containing protein [Striga asiatica]|uniref:Rieske (2Fe-2S) domain-containing protein n=1 Tax=Striga asiatica TaxID=4170 RepID=A0A5A7R9J5_STRAF|nr:Rieske (2Fe-2S) domain-containing protein [Striga asiatica]